MFTLLLVTPEWSKAPPPAPAHLIIIHLLGGHHEIIPDVLGAVLAGAVKEILLLELLLPITGNIEEVHVGHRKLLPCADLPQGSQLNPEGEQ